MKHVKNLLLILFLLVACTDDITSPADSDSPASGLTASFSSIQELIFSSNCARSGCHSGATPREGLNLTSGNSYSNLVGVASNQSNLLRVKAGSSSESWLVKKITADGTSIMPPSGSLMQATIDTIITWIDRGALNN